MGIYKAILPKDLALSSYRMNDVSNWTRINTEWMGARKKFILIPPQAKNKYMIKFPNYGENEILIELFNCYLALNLGLKTASYFPCIYRGEKGIITKSFLKQDEYGSELWEMKELICHYSGVANIEFKMGRDKEVLLEHDIDLIQMILANEFGEKILPAFYQMVGFDCLIGHGDRHWCNYGVILSYSSAAKKLEFNFSPIYDTASGYLLEMTDLQVEEILKNKTLDDTKWYFPKKKGLCKMTCQGNPKTNHIDLFAYILETEKNPKYIDALIAPIKKYNSKIVTHLLGNHFSELSSERKSVIIKILEMRFAILKELIIQREHRC